MKSRKRTKISVEIPCSLCYHFWHSDQIKNQTDFYSRYCKISKRECQPQTLGPCKNFTLANYHYCKQLHCFIHTKICATRKNNLHKYNYLWPDECRHCDTAELIECAEIISKPIPPNLPVVNDNEEPKTKVTRIRRTITTKPKRTRTT